MQERIGRYEILERIARRRARDRLPIPFDEGLIRSIVKVPGRIGIFREHYSPIVSHGYWDVGD